MPHSRDIHCVQPAVWFAPEWGWLGMSLLCGLLLVLLGRHPTKRWGCRPLVLIIIRGMLGVHLSRRWGWSSLVLLHVV